MLPQFGTGARKNLNKSLDKGPSGDVAGATPDKASVDAAWLVLEAANDLGDHAAVEACRRVLDAGLNGAAASRSDLDLVLDYFR